MASYALVPRGEPLEVPLPEEEDRGDDGSSRTTKQRQQQQRRRQENEERAVRDELLSIYESYAALYPNPKLFEERQERAELLRALDAASEAAMREEEANSKKSAAQSTTTGRGGLFRWLGFREGGGDSSDTSKRSRKKGTKRILTSDYDDEEDDDRLLYADLKKNDDDGDDGADDDYLCGTQASLDLACVPDEAWSFARFHLASERRGKLNVARSAWETKAGSSLMAVTGLGLVAEFRPSAGRAAQQRTSDHDWLVRNKKKLRRRKNAGSVGEDDKASGDDWNFGYARAATVGPNVLLIAWGRFEGQHDIVMYRRRKPTNDDDSVHWYAVAVIPPTRAVVSNIQQQADVFVDDNDDSNGAPSSALLRVTDLCPLVVEVSEDGGDAPAVTLAIARLGGYVELVPLPPNLWYGPEISVPVRKHRQGKSPYRNLPNLSQGPSVTAVTTSEYQTDLLCLEAFRTSVNSDSVWDQTAYPNAPPAEHMLAATGSHKDNRHRQVATFWSVSTIFADEGDGTTGATSMNYTLHATVAEAMDLGPVGPEITVFASKALMRFWRRPRSVQLREAKAPATTTGAPDDIPPSSSSDPAKRVTTLSVAAPVTTLRFASNKNKTAAEDGQQSLPSDGNNSNNPYLALLDWNGGVTVMDCGLLERVVAQNLADDEYELLFRNEDPDTVIPLARILSDRSQVWQQIVQSSRQRLSLSSSPSPQSHSITDIQWLTQRLNPSRQEVGSNDDDRPRLALVTYNPSCLWILPFPLPEDTSDIDSTMATPLKNGGVAAVALWTTRAGQIALLSSSVSLAKSSTQLSLSILDKLDPRTIVQALVHESKYEEAIQAAEQLGPIERESVSEMVEKSKMDLWISSGDVHSLETVGDSSYVIRQALSLHEGSEDSMLLMQGSDDKDRLKLFRKVHRVALERAVNNSNSDSANGDCEDVPANVEELRGRLIALGTYELLCRYFGIKPSFHKFCNEFLPTPVLDLAKSLAKRGELGGLSIVGFRHRWETMSPSVEVVNDIPLTIRPYLYHHLLPVPTHDENELHHYFLTASTESPLQEWSYMPQYLKENAGITVVLDDEDRRLVLGQRRVLPLCLEEEEDGLLLGFDRSSSIDGWYAARVEDMQNFSSSLEYTIELCRFGLAALGETNESMANTSSASLSPAGGRLQRTLACAEALENMLLGGDVEATNLITPPSFVTLNLDDFETMGTVDLVALVFEGLSANNPEIIYSRFNNALVPLLANEMFSAKDTSVDNAICSYCCGLLDKSIDHQLDDVPGLLGALQMCAAISSLSRSSKDVHNRVIKEGKSLAKLGNSVFDMFLRAASSLTHTSLSLEDVRVAINALWVIYESLPMRIQHESYEDEQSEDIHLIADEMFENLVLLDMLSQWPGCESISIVSSRSNTDDQEFAVHVLASLCNSFCYQIKNDGRAGKSKDLLTSLISDVEELRRLRIFQPVNFNKVLSESLFSPLMGQRHFELVDKLLSLAPTNFKDSGMACAVIMSFFNEIVFNSNECDMGDMQAAIACRSLISKHFPAAQDDFQSSWRYLDVAGFINNVLLCGIPLNNNHNIITPKDLLNQFPIDVIDSLLVDHPELIICDCEDWADQEWAMQANKAARDLISARQQQDSEEEESPLQPTLTGPTTPGGAIFHLAQLLGLVTPSAVIAVKCLVIHYGVVGGLCGAAAAVCRTLLPGEGTQPSSSPDAITFPILEAVAKVVSHPDYHDYMTKQELCREFFSWFAMDLETELLCAFDETLLTQEQLEYGRLRDLETTGANNDLQAVRRLFVDTRNEYSAELCDLFSTLQQQARDGWVDDSLLNALSRFVIYWCIAQCTRPKVYQPSSSEKANARALVELASSLLLHVNENSISRASLHELQRILEEQETVPKRQAPLVEPDMGLVRRLVSRGYSQHGARRAVVMTQNKGFNQAVQWAIAHSFDNGFDDPLVFLQNDEQVFFDEVGARQLKACLNLTDSLISGKSTLSLSKSPTHSADHNPPGMTTALASQKDTQSGTLNGSLTVNGKSTKARNDTKSDNVITGTMSRSIVTEPSLSGNAIGASLPSVPLPPPMPVATEQSSQHVPAPPMPVPTAQEKLDTGMSNVEMSEMGWDEDEDWDFDEDEDNATTQTPPPPPQPQHTAVEPKEGWEDDEDLILDDDDDDEDGSFQKKPATTQTPPPPPPQPQHTSVEPKEGWEDDEDLNLDDDDEDEDVSFQKKPATTQTPPPPPHPQHTSVEPKEGWEDDEDLFLDDDDDVSFQKKRTETSPPPPPPLPPPQPQRSTVESRKGWEDDEDLSMGDDDDVSFQKKSDTASVQASPKLEHLDKDPLDSLSLPKPQRQALPAKARDATQEGQLKLALGKSDELNKIAVNAMPEVASSDDTKSTVDTLPITRNSQVLKLEPARKNEAKPNLHIETRNVIPMPTKLSTTALAASQAASKSSIGRRHSPVLSIDPKPPPSRSSLLLRGQAFFKEARKASSPTDDERERLLEVGRRLLEKVRTSPQTSASEQTNHAKTVFPMVSQTKPGAGVTTNPSGLDFDDGDQKDGGWGFDDDLFE